MMLNMGWIHRRSSGAFVFAALVVPLVVQTAAGQMPLRDLRPGDILVGDNRSNGGGPLIRVDPVTGLQTPITTVGPYISAVSDMAFDAAGNLIVVDAGNASVVRVDRQTGVQTPVSTGGSLVFPSGVVIHPGGQIIVADDDTPDLYDRAAGALFTVDPVSGGQTLLRDAGSAIQYYWANPTALVIDAGGDLLVVDQGPTDIQCIFKPGKLVRFDPISGLVCDISTEGYLNRPYDVAIGPAGQLYVTDYDALHDPNDPECSFQGPGAVLRIDPVTGDQAVVSSGNFFVNPYSVAVETDGTILVVDGDTNRLPGNLGAVIRVHPVTGVQTILSEAQYFGEPHLVLIVPGSSPPRLGDIDFDGDVDSDDLNLFLRVLLGVEINPAYRARCDLNSDGFPDGRDIQPFVPALIGG